MLRPTREAEQSRPAKAQSHSRQDLQHLLSAPGTEEEESRKFPCSLIAAQTAWLLGFIRQQGLVCSGLSLRPDVPNSESAEAQLLLKQLAGIVAQNPPADHAL